MHEKNAEKYCALNCEINFIKEYSKVKSHLNLNLKFQDNFSFLLWS